MKKNKNSRLQFKRGLFTTAVQNALKKKNYKKLADLIELADEYGVRKPLRAKGWLATGTYWQSGGYHSDAVIAFNSARVLQPTNIKTLSALFFSFDKFITEYRDLFSSEDLDSMLDQLQRLLEFYKLQKMWDSPPIEQGKQVYRRINYLRINAKSAVETPATARVDRIVKAFRENVTMEEVAADYARIMAPVFLELLAEDIDDERKEKKKKAKKKKLEDSPEDPEPEKKK